MLRKLTVLAVGASLAIGLPALSVAVAPTATALDNGLALTPPMGWNDWNSFGCDINEQDVIDTIDLFVSTGLRDAGYTYINIDDCWAESSRNEAGELVPNAEDFPDGIAYLADYAHAKGLKLGIYSSAGDTTCQRVQPGSLGHELTDARTFVSWGIDYLKYDNCGTKDGYEETQASYIARYQVMADAIAQVKEETGKSLLYSICEWGNYEPWTWAGEQGNLWRTTFDISDTYSSMLGIFKDNVQLAQYAEPGAWNDPDMLQVGNGGMTNEEYRTHFSLWAMMAAPLLIGTDLREADDDTMDIFLNTDVIAVDQDTLGKQATLISESNGLYVLAKPLSNGDVAVALFNSGAKARTISTTTTAVGAASSKNYKLTDLWSKEATATTKNISAYVAGHQTVVYRVSATSQVRPSTTLSIKASSESVKAGGKTRITVTLKNNSNAKLTRASVKLARPDGWKQLSRNSGRTTIAKGSKSTTTFLVKAPKATTPINAASFTATSSFRSGGITYTGSAALELSSYKPVSSTFRLADTTSSDDAVFGQLGSAIQVQAAGSGVGPATSSFTGTTAASDEYGAVYRRKSVDADDTVQVTVTTVGGTGSADRTGVMVRNDMDGGPVGVALYVNGQNSVSMVYSTEAGTEYTASYPVSQRPGPGGGGVSVTLPVTLKLERSGSTFIGYYSTDAGATFTRIGGDDGSVTIPDAAVVKKMDGGVFHTSGSGAAATTAEVTGLVVS
ncbi:NEW3 domain-containing protein [Propionicimonas sp.]|uniref:NEW3 domain-containing protein n=1 Tax=Propionicimonas sp. TaxID=1955623 RepID=UPI0039E6EE62